MSVPLLAILAVALFAAARALWLRLCAIARRAVRKPAVWAAVAAAVLAAQFPLASVLTLASVTAVALVIAVRVLMPPAAARSAS